MNELCMIMKDTVKPNFLNIRTSIKTYDRDALVGDGLITHFIQLTDGL